jgi:hypothetical protein
MLSPSRVVTGHHQGKRRTIRPWSEHVQPSPSTPPTSPGRLPPHTAELSADIYQLIVREIPQLRTDRRVLTLLEASVAENVATVLHILQHGIGLDHVHAPAAAEQYARRLAQRGIPMAALLRAYRIGSTRFQHWCLQELAAQTDDAAIVSDLLGVADLGQDHLGTELCVGEHAGRLLAVQPDHVGDDALAGTDHLSAGRGLPSGEGW